MKSVMREELKLINEEEFKAHPCDMNPLKLLLVTDQWFATLLPAAHKTDFTWQLWSISLTWIPSCFPTPYPSILKFIKPTDDAQRQNIDDVAVDLLCYLNRMVTAYEWRQKVGWLTCD